MKTSVHFVRLQDSEMTKGPWTGVYVKNKVPRYSLDQFQLEGDSSRVTVLGDSSRIRYSRIHA
jgi:hypothetical protein